MGKQTMVRIEVDVLEKLRASLEGETVNQFLKRTIEKQENPLEALRVSLLKQVGSINQKLDSIDDAINILFKETRKMLLQREKNEMYLNTMLGLLTSYISLVDKRPQLQQEIADQAKKIVEDIWQEHLKKNKLDEFLDEI